MKIDYYFPSLSPTQAAEAARRARRLGFDGFFSAETSHDPFPPLFLANHAEPELDLGTAITVAFPRSPMVLAHTAWDLAEASQGKFMLGLGTQIKVHINRRFSTEWSHPTDRLREYIHALRSIWDTWQNRVPLKFQGEFYQFSLMTPFFDPGPIAHPDIPIYIAGVGPYLSRLAGEVCQGFHVHPFHTVDYLDQVVFPNMEEGLTASGRTRDEVEIVSTVFVVTGHNQVEMEQAMAATKQQMAFYASTPSYKVILDVHGWEIMEKLNKMSKQGQWEQMGEVITDDMVAEVGVVAPIDRLGEAIKERYGGRMQRVGYYLNAPDDWSEEEWKEVIAQTR